MTISNKAKVASFFLGALICLFVQASCSQSAAASRQSPATYQGRNYSVEAISPGVLPGREKACFVLMGADGHPVGISCVSY